MGKGQHFSVTGRGLERSSNKPKTKNVGFALVSVQQLI